MSELEKIPIPVTRKLASVYFRDGLPIYTLGPIRHLSEEDRAEWANYFNEIPRDQSKYMKLWNKNASDEERAKLNGQKEFS